MRQSRTADAAHPFMYQGSPQKPGRGLQSPEVRGAAPRCLSVCLLQRPFRENQDSVHKAGGFSAHAELCAGCPLNYCAKGAGPSQKPGRFDLETHLFFGSAPWYPGKNCVAPEAVFKRCAPFYGDKTIHFVRTSEPFKR